MQNVHEVVCYVAEKQANKHTSDMVLRVKIEGISTPCV